VVSPPACRLPLLDLGFPRSLSDIAVRDEAKEVRPDARPQAWKNRRRIRWNTLRIFSGRERRRWSQIVRRSRKVNVGQAPWASRPSEPTCSEYARAAISRYGMPRGHKLAICRLLKCYPFLRGEMDPVKE
jgi:hypothetical protein